MLLWLRMLRVDIQSCANLLVNWLFQFLLQTSSIVFGPHVSVVPENNAFEIMALLGDSPLCLSGKKHWGNHSTPIFTQVFKYCCKYWLEVIWFVFKRSLRFRFDPICQFGLLHVRFNCPCGSPRDDCRKKRRGPVWDPGLISIPQGVRFGFLEIDLNSKLYQHVPKGAIWTLRDGVQGPLIIHSTHLGRSRYMNSLNIHSVEWISTLIRAVTLWELCISQFLVEDSHFASPGRTESKIESQSSRGTVAGPVFPTKSAKVSGGLYWVFPYISLTA